MVTILLIPSCPSKDYQKSMYCLSVFSLSTYTMSDKIPSLPRHLKTKGKFIITVAIRSIDFDHNYRELCQLNHGVKPPADLRLL
jgi:hypothetical protein